ncbi:MAG: F0F1 ATP synthase subunit gamma [Holosporales bacterium]|nr:F0F1 ATP synthase subunit gamma [Holosporales bacterium]
MENWKAIKNRIKTVSSIIKTMNSIKLVATIKLSRVNNINKCSKQCSDILFNMLLKAVDDCLFNEEFPDAWFNREKGKQLILVLSTNQGFCGSLNQSIVTVANELIRMHEGAYVEVFGKKGNEIPQNRAETTPLQEAAMHSVVGFSQYLTALTVNYVLNHEVNEVFLVSGEHKSILVQNARSLQLFPIDKESANEKENVKIEGDRLKFLEEVFRMYLFELFKGLVTEHLVSEYSSRVMTMDNSVRNASDMFEKLKVLSNRIRQDKITQELTEIISSIECIR